MKIAAAYSIFNGEELLEDSIKQIHEVVSDIIICYQTISNKGNKSDTIYPFVRRFIGRPKFHIIEFVPNLQLNTKQNERNKLQLRLDYAKMIGATHILPMATDHFYRKDELEYAINKIKLLDYDITFTKMYTYYKHKNWIVDPIEDYHAPFITKILPETEIKRIADYPVYTDPSVQFSTCRNWYLFDQKEIMMHHYSMVRCDLRNKFANAAASIRWKPEDIERFIKEYENAKIGDSISYFGGRKLIEASIIISES